MTLTKSEREVIRTTVATAAGAGISYLTKAEAHLTPIEAVAFVIPAATLYSSAIHALEEKYPSLGWLLGALPQSLPTKEHE
jgi:hypothetical protein